MIAQGAFRAASELRRILAHLEGRWFDFTRHVITCGHVPAERLAQDESNAGFDYLPTRPTRARQILRALPIDTYSQYTFVDLGSGKGRMLFLAAEFPFYSVEGIEVSEELHRQAQENIDHWRPIRRRCQRVQSHNIDAADYRFPDRDFVMYLFNPFGLAIIDKVLNNLNESLTQHPRRVWIMLLTPQFASSFDTRLWLQCYRRESHYCIYGTPTR